MNIDSDAFAARLAALELLVEQLIVDRCLETELPELTATRAARALSQLAHEREEQAGDVAERLAAIMARVLGRVREA